MTEYIYNKNLIDSVRLIIISIGILLTYGFLLYLSDRIRNFYANTITIVNGQLKQGHQFKLDKKIDKIRKIGALDKFPKMGEPVYYILYHLLFAVIFALWGFFIPYLFIEKIFGLFGAFIGFLIGYKILDLYLDSVNRSEDIEITRDVLTVSNILIGQISGGQYTGSALGECSDIVKNKRFKKAIEEFDRSLKMGEKTLIEATKALNDKFTNLDVDNLCMVLIQNEESGKSKTIIQDLSQQILASERASHEREKQKLERLLTYAILILFADIMGYVAWVFITSISETINII